MTIIGRLADSPEIVPTSTGQDVVRYALGTSHGPKDNRQTSWWRVALFAPEGGLRDLVMGLGKGSMVCVEGDCSMNKFQAKDGSQQSALNIVQSTFLSHYFKFPALSSLLDCDGLVELGLRILKADFVDYREPGDH